MTISPRIDRGRVLWPRSTEEFCKIDFTTLDALLLQQYADEVQLRILHITNSLEEGLYLFDAVGDEIDQGEAAIRRRRMIGAKSSLQAREQKVQRFMTRAAPPTITKQDRHLAEVERARVTKEENSRKHLEATAESARLKHEAMLLRLKAEETALATQQMKAKTREADLAMRELKAKREQVAQDAEAQRKINLGHRIVGPAMIMSQELLLMRAGDPLPAVVVAIATDITRLNEFDGGGAGWSMAQETKALLKKAKDDDSINNRVNKLHFTPRKMEAIAGMRWMRDHVHQGDFTWEFTHWEHGTGVRVRCTTCEDSADVTDDGGDISCSEDDAAQPLSVRDP